VTQSRIDLENEADDRFMDPEERLRVAMDRQ
jgi:hypothetical protein